MTDIDPTLIDQLAKHCKTESDVFGEKGVVKQLIKQILERALETELTHHVGYEKHDSEGKSTSNSRNGYSKKLVKSDLGAIELDTPRDRDSSFEPQIIKKRQTRFEGLDGKILSLYSRGLSTRDIQAELKDMYDVEVSPMLISEVTDAVLEEVKAWQSRPLDDVYPIVYLDALVLKVKENKRIINKSFYCALGVDSEGQKDLLGIWVSENEGAKFWLSVLTELKNRGVKDILIACVDGLTGFPEAIESVFPKTQVQLCIVHMVRNSLRFVGWKERKKVAADLKLIYQAKTIDEAELALNEFAEKWDEKFPSISSSWQRNWANIIPLFDYPAEIRRAIYTTNAIESMNMTLRKVIKNKRFFPSDDAAFKQLYLAIQNISKKWTMPIRNWSQALNHFMIVFDGRLK